MTYEKESQKTVSEKAILAHIEPSGRLPLWQLDSGAIYKRSVAHYVIDIKKDETSLTEASSSSLAPGQWFFDYSTKTVYLRLSDDSNPL